jgi:cytochrome c553
LLDPSRTHGGAVALVLCLVLLMGGCGAPGAPVPGTLLSSSDGRTAGSESAAPGHHRTLDQVLLGRQLILSHGCMDCHGGPGPESGGWLAGRPGERAAYVFGDFRAWAANLTPDPETGLGRYTDRQVFNALRYGLRPATTPDVTVTSSVPGTGSHPDEPDYLSPLMPWTSWRRMSDTELWAVIAYLRNAVAPARNEIPQPVSPPDRWASWFTPEAIGPHPLVPFPTLNEALGEGADREQVLRGRQLVVSHACGECHGGRGNPAADGWLAGVRSPEERPRAIPFEQELRVGSFHTYPRNLTPHNTTGLGRFSERQIFNALRYGLRPGETADVEITSTVPGVGNHPAHPKYLSPSMPWTAWRHLGDDDLWAIAAYLKHGLRPVANRVADSEGPPDFWVGLFTPENFGIYPAPPYPTGNERPIR